jgi:hypothetical protein
MDPLIPVEHEYEYLGKITSSVLGQGSDLDFVFIYHHDPLLLPPPPQPPDGVVIERVEEECDVLAVFDGHHNPKMDKNRSCTSLLREAPLSVLLLEKDPVEALRRYLSEKQDLYDIHSGTVGSIARIYKNRVEDFNVGDCTTMVFINGSLARINELHNGQNQNEVDRLLRDKAGQHRFDRNNVWTIQVKNACDAVRANASYVIFPEYNICLAPTQNFGHHDVCGFNPDTKVTYFEDTDHVHIVMFSDGVGDVFTDFRSEDHDHEDMNYIATHNAFDIAKMSEKRWKQNWNYSEPGKPPCQAHHSDYDDVSVVSWTKM